MTALAKEDSGLVGTWDVRITDLAAPGGPTTFEGATTFAPGGTVVTMDSNSPSTGLGSWDNTGDGTFRARFMQFGFSPQGTSKVVVSPRGRLSEEATISGTFTYKVYDLQGHLLFGNGKGTFTGKRFAA
jgi:hypothetical protein